MMATRPSGRPRDRGIDDAVLAQALDQLSRVGYEALSVSAVAGLAGTSRQAVYRRWPGKSDLARAAVDHAAAGRGPVRAAGGLTTPLYDELVDELGALQREMSAAGDAGLAAAVTLLDVAPEVRSRYRQRVSGPRQRRVRRILEAAVADRLLPTGADVELGVLSTLGALSAATLSGRSVGRRWPERAAAMLWRSLGGTPPAPRRRERGRGR